MEDVSLRIADPAPGHMAVTDETSPASRLPRPPRAILAMIAAPVMLIGACGPSTVQADPAPTASDPLCAQVLQALPDELAGQRQRSTNSQASRAWGDPAILLRCGVQPLGPTTDRCIGVVDASGVEVDWVVDELGAEDQGRGTWTFTTYGRTPAIEVTVPVEYAADGPDALLMSLSDAVELLPQDRRCL